MEILSNYPPAVLERAARPTGLAFQVAYPNLAKFGEHLERWAAENYEHEQRIERANRKALPEPPSEDRGLRPTLQQMQEKYGKDWGLTPREKPAGPKFKAPSKEDLTAHYREYGLAFQPKQKTAAE